MRIPSEEECFRMLCETETMEHIAHHSFQVCRVAVFLTDKLKEKNISHNRDLIRAAAMLHDVTKTRSLKTGESHAETGAQLVYEHGYPEVANIIRQHVRLDDYSSAPPSPAEIVNYSDKRVVRTDIVSLDERMKYIMECYGKTQKSREYIAINWKKTEELEKKFFGILTFKPEDIAGLLEADNTFEQFRKWCETNNVEIGRSEMIAQVSGSPLF